MTTCATCRKTITRHAFVSDLRAFCSKACQCRTEQGSPHQAGRKYCSRCHAPEIEHEKKSYKGRRQRARR